MGGDTGAALKQGKGTKQAKGERGKTKGTEQTKGERDKADERRKGKDERDERCRWGDVGRRDCDETPGKRGRNLRWDFS